MSAGAAYKSNAPTLTYLDLCYGEGSSVTWLVAWVSDVYGICGFVNEVSDNVKIATARAIMREYHFLNLAEVIVFFRMFIAGKFEKFYKKPNPQVITTSLSEYCVIRIEAVREIELTKVKEQGKAEADKKNAITYDEWVAQKKAKGESVNIELIEDEKGNKMFKAKKPKADERLDAAYMIVKNTTNASFDVLCRLREDFIKKYDIDPYEIINKLGDKKLKEYEERRNSQGNR